METWLSWVRKKLLSSEPTLVSDHSVTEPRKRAPYEQSEYMETWLSGRKHLTANEAGSKRPPGFESLRLRRGTT